MWYDPAMKISASGCLLVAGITLASLFCEPCFAQNKAFHVTDITPGNKTRGVELEPLIQIHVSQKFDPASLTGQAIQLFRFRGKQVKVNVGGDLGGVVTLSVETPLATDTEYELKVTAALKNLDGDSIEPIAVRFHTTEQPTRPPRKDIADFRFMKQRIERRDGVCGLALSGSRLFACTWDGKLIAYPLDDTGLRKTKPLVLLKKRRRFNAIVADPESTDRRTILWLSHDSQHGLSLGPNDHSGAIARVIVENGKAELEDVLTGLPTGDHPASGLTFGPDGRLYVSQGALSMLGGKPKTPETPLSAATLAIDLKHELWQNNSPVDVRNFDASTKPKALQVFATGIREAFDLCWHSGGGLYAGINMNDTDEKTPARDGLPAVNARPTEMMLRIVEGKYYGHPNPSRNEWVLLGGNPTSKVDPWEVESLPVGTKPEANFDPALLIRNLEKDKGPSADGVCEWTTAGPLKKRLLFCFYTATRGIHSYRLSENGRQIIDHQPLVDRQNRILRFGAPLDIVHDPRGWLYVADFSAPQRGDSGRSGGVWVVKPLQDSSVVFRDNSAGVFRESFEQFDATRFRTKIPNKNTSVRNGRLWTRGKSGGKYPPMVYLDVQGKDIEIAFRYRHLQDGGMVWFFVDGDDGFGSVDHMLRVKMLRTGIQLQIDSHSLNPNHPERLNKNRPADKVSKAYRLNKRFPLERFDLSDNTWRDVKLVFKGETVVVSVDGKSWIKTLKHSCFNATKRKLLWMQNGGEKGIEIDDIVIRDLGRTESDVKSKAGSK